MRLSQTIAIAALTALSLCGCDSLARFTRVTSIPTSASARHNAQGEPGSVASGWQPLVEGQMYAVWHHDYSIDAPCNEWDSEPVVEVDGHGALCKSVVP